MAGLDEAAAEPLGAAEGAEVPAGPVATASSGRAPVRLPPLPQRRTDAWPGEALAPAAPTAATATATWRDGAVPLPDLPGAARRRPRFGLLLFLALAAAPTAAAAVYLFGFASNQYASEFRFTVMQSSFAATPGPSTAAGSGAGGAIAALAGIPSTVGAGAISPSITQNYVVTDFLTSRQATDELQRRIGLRALYTRPGIDAWSRFRAGGSTEAFARYWRGKMSSDFDPVTGLASVRVSAFSPGDALAIARTMAAISEELINRINSRVEADALRSAEAEVTRAAAHLKEVRARLRGFRTSSGVIDPTAGAVPTNTDLARQLREQLAGVQAQVAALRAQGLAADAPRVQVLQSQIASLQAQYGAARAEVTASSLSGRPLTGVVSDYEELTLDNTYAQSALTSALQARDQARANAAARHLFITPYVEPALPDGPSSPNRLGELGLFFLGACATWLVALLLVRSVRDHQL